MTRVTLGTGVCGGLGWIWYPTQGNGTFDEYRYDAFGRRVLTRTRRVGPCNEPCDAFIERTVYDGDQVLAEIRSVGKTGISSGYLEAEGAVEPTGAGDLFGLVLNAHAQGIDAPSHVLKWRPTWVGGNAGWNSVTPHADWRGTYAYGTYEDGSPCTTVSPVCPAWPGYRVSAYGADQGVLPQEYTVWVGSLLRGRQDASGLTYLRNRYYDANTGRFTQEDPIGMAGGLNLYRYAGGDPINLSDPFGLSAQKVDDEEAASDTTGQEKKDGYLACVQRMASANVETFDETVAGWFGAASGAAGRAAQFGGGVLASHGMAASGYATSPNASLAGRWLLNKSAVPAMRPLRVQGIRVGATSAGALTTTALAAGVATNAAAGAAVYYGFRGGVWMGSYVVGMHLCSEK